MKQTSVELSTSQVLGRLALKGSALLLLAAPARANTATVQAHGYSFNPTMPQVRTEP